MKLKAFMDSLKHACKVPNTDQPYACVDMMVVGVVLDKVLGLHQSSLLLTPHQVYITFIFLPHIKSQHRFLG